ncbi:MAG: homocysteine methyltransferase [Ruminococcaceae bacterium]|nr:homocysteine methyltransferase [Oscillospiraceae bacterium]
MDILSEIKKGFVFFDGGMGTQLQARGLQAGECPEMWNITHPEEITQIHKAYFESGANIATTNTFGANPIKIENTEKVVLRAVENAKKAIYAPNQYVALDIGPTGKLLKPLGDLDFDDAYNAFKATVKAGVKAGCDLIIIETMNDPYEIKAAVLAAKENSSLPVFATFVLDEKGKTVTGCDVQAMVALLEGLGVDALGVNCSLGAEELKKFVPEIVKYSSLPVIVNPNAGMPCVIDGKTCYDSTPERFAEAVKEIAGMGARILGGCCGTTPEHIAQMRKALEGTEPIEITKKSYTVVSSYSHACTFDNKVVLIGERINPTGKSKLKAALRENNLNYLVSEAIGQEEKGAHMLDVNVGLPEINESEMLVNAIKEIQSVTALPLQIDTSDPVALEKAMRIYNGKPLVNSVNGKKESMEAVLPLVKKYGGVVIALTLDENGIPNTAKGRVEIAKRIIEKAAEYGIEKKDIIVDPLCLTVSSDKNAPSVTLEAIEILKNKVGVKTSLGISNVSFGLPSRDYVNSVFFSHALLKGLDAVIMNPYSTEMMKVYYAHNALVGIDDMCVEYINFAGDNQIGVATVANEDITLEKAIFKGLKKEAKEITERLITNNAPLDIVNDYIIPALDKVGENYEKGIIFLPQLLMSAETATVAFDVVKESIKGDGEAKKGDIILATVKGDIHDIGKNIVKVILQNYGYNVYDMGKDVSPEVVLECALKNNIKLIGLSALMTTTVPAMEATIKLVRSKIPDAKFMVGGAVLTPEYAEMIGADNYSKDAMEAVRYAQQVFNN